MICRVAESCYWMWRQLERVDSMARLLEATHGFNLDALLPEQARWRPALTVTGEAQGFIALYGEALADDGESVQRYLCWERASAVSILSAAFWARENARTIREVISRPMWEGVNALWLWLQSDDARALYEADRHGFYSQTRELILRLRGIMEDATPRDEAYEFMRLGLMLERASQTARLVDVRFASRSAGAGSGAAAFAQWSALLRACDATEAFLRPGKPLRPDAVVAFLVCEDDFPRAVRYSVTRAARVMRKLLARDTSPISRDSPALLSALSAQLGAQATLEALEADAHLTLTQLLDALATLMGAVQRDFFAVALPQALENASS